MSVAWYSLIIAGYRIVISTFIGDDKPLLTVLRA